MQVISFLKKSPSLSSSYRCVSAAAQTLVNTEKLQPRRHTQPLTTDQNLELQADCSWTEV